jgi:hypothetical protein
VSRNPEPKIRNLGSSLFHELWKSITNKNLIVNKMNKQQAAAYNNQTDFILDHPVSFASDLFYSIATDVEENLQRKIINRNCYENWVGLNQAGVKLLFLNQALQSAQKPIYTNSYNQRTATLLIYHHEHRLSPYLLLIIEFDYISLLESSMNGKATTQSTNNITKRREIQSEKVKILNTLKSLVLRYLKSSVHSGF